MSDLLKNFSWPNLIWSAVLIGLSILFWLLVRKLRDSLMLKVEANFGDNVRRKAAVSTLFNVIKYAIIGLCTLTVLQLNGINVTSILAGLGIAGAIAGLAWQDVFKDFIQGVRIMSDGFFSTGDYIRYNGGEYQVVEFSMRTTKLRSMANHDLVTVSNRNITEVTRISGTQYLNIGLSYDTSMEKADEVLSDAADRIAELANVTECKYLGFKEFQDSSTDYLLRLCSEPKDLYSVRRAAMKILRERLDAAGLEIPYNQLDIHQK